MQQVSNYELELLKIIWNNNGMAMYAKIMEELENKGNILTKNTVITLLSRLIEKGFLKTHKIGRRNKYSAIVSEYEYQSVQTEKFLKKLYEGNAKELVSTLIQRDLLSPEDYEDLRCHWNNSDQKE